MSLAVYSGFKDVMLAAKENVSTEISQSYIISQCKEIFRRVCLLELIELVKYHIIYINF